MFVCRSFTMVLVARLLRRTRWLHGYYILGLPLSYVVTRRSSSTSLLVVYGSLRRVIYSIELGRSRIRPRIAVVGLRTLVLVIGLTVALLSRRILAFGRMRGNPRNCPRIASLWRRLLLLMVIITTRRR